MLIEVYRVGKYAVYHNTTTGHHLVEADRPQYTRWITEPCWHSPNTPCPAVEQEKGKKNE